MYEPDERLLKHFDMAKLYENSEFETRYVNKEVLHDNEIINSLKNIESRYEIIEEIGCGGMKRIQRARDKFTGREVALATIKNIDSAEDVENFLREARLTASLQHQNIIPVYDLGVDSGSRPYFSMKLIEGENLNTIIKRIQEGNRGYRGRYKLRVLLDIFLKVCDAVKYAHSCGVVHLDLKPQNIQVSEHGEVLLCDWGIARRLDDISVSSFDTGSFKMLEERDATLDTFIKGTPGYMSPEQAMGKWDDTGKKTDIFSLGAILYTILTLRVPFESKSLEKMIDDTCDGNLIIPTYLTPERNVPEPLEAICLKCMEVDRIARYVSVRKLADDIRAWEEGFVTSVEDITFRGQMRSFYKRNRKACFIAAGIFFCFLCFSGVFMALLYQSKEKADDARLKTEKTINDMIEIEKEKAELGKAAAERIITKAQDLINSGQILKAEETVKYAVGLNPNLPTGWEMLSKLQILNLDFDEAYKSARASGKRPIVELCRKILNMGRGKVAMKMGAFWHFTHNSRESYWKEQIYRIIKAAGENNSILEVADFLEAENSIRSLKFSYSEEDGKVKLDLSGNRTLKNITSLKALTLSSLNLSTTGVKSIDGLQKQPLEYLNLYHTGVTDLKPLKGMPLKFLSVEGSSTNDFSPLGGSPIKRIEFGRARFNLKSLNKLENLEEVEFPQGLFTAQEFGVLDKRIKVLFRDFRIGKQK